MNHEEIFGLAEFTEAWKAEFKSRIADNYSKQTQNKQAEDIIHSILECQDTYQPASVIKLAEFSRNQKTLDARWSLFSDLFKMSTAVALMIIDGIHHKKDDDTPALIPARYPYIAVSIVEVATFLKSFYHGYQSSITRHLSKELTNSFVSVVEDFIESYKTANEASSSNTIISVNQSRKYQNDQFGDLSKRISTTINFLAFSSEVPRFLFNFPRVSGVNTFFGQAFGSEDRIEFAAGFTEIGSAILSLGGKEIACLSSETNEELVKSRIEQAEKSLQEFDTSHHINTSEAKRILELLTDRYQSRIKDPGFFAKYIGFPINLLINSIYGSSYDLFKSKNITTQQTELEMSSIIVQDEPEKNQIPSPKPSQKIESKIIEDQNGREDQKDKSRLHPLDNRTYEETDPKIFKTNNSEPEIHQNYDLKNLSLDFDQSSESNQIDQKPKNELKTTKVTRLGSQQRSQSSPLSN